MRDLLRHRGARLVVAGQSVSAFGDWLLMLVFGIWVKDLTGSNGAAGAVILAMAAPGLLAPIAGLVVDRLPRRRLLVVNDVLAAAALSPLLLVHDRRGVWIVYLVAALYGLSRVVLDAGVTALVQELVDADLLAPVNGALATVRQSMRLVGPLVGAGLYVAGGIRVLVGLDAATFLLSALAFAAIRGGTGRPGAAARGRLRAEVADGWRFVRADRVLRPVFVTTVVALSCIGFLEPAVFAIVAAFGRPAPFVGVVATAQGAGAVVGGLTASLVIGRIGAPRALQVAMLGLAVLLAVVALPWFWVVMAAVPLAGALLPLLDVSLTTMLQRRTPPALMGRVAALLNLALTVPTMVSIAVGAALVDRTGYVVLMLAAGLALLVGGVLAVARVPADDQSSAYVDDRPGVSIC